MIETAIDRAIAVVERGPVISAAEIDGTIGPEWTPTEAVGQVVYFSWLDDDAIPEGHRHWVRHHTDRAAQMLGLGHVAIRWFGPSVPGQAPDFCGESRGAGEVAAGVAPENQPMTIALNASARGDVVVATIAHECRHVLQAVLLAKIGTPEKREADAEEFAAYYMAREPR